MSSPYTIEPSGRTKPCTEGCRHPTCAALVVDIEKRAREIRAAQVRALVDTVHAGIVGSPTLVQRADATNALQDLAQLVRGV